MQSCVRQRFLSDAWSERQKARKLLGVRAPATKTRFSCTHDAWKPRASWRGALSSHICVISLSTSTVLVGRPTSEKPPIAYTQGSPDRSAARTAARKRGREGKDGRLWGQREQEQTDRSITSEHLPMRLCVLLPWQAGRQSCPIRCFCRLHASPPWPAGGMEYGHTG